MTRQLHVSGLPSDRVVCLPGGVDTASFQVPTASERAAARARLGISDGIVVFLFVGRLEPVKGVTTLLEGWKRSASSFQRRLLIVGEGSLSKELRVAVDAEGLGDVSLEGEHTDVSKYLHAADVFVLPSEWEGISNALLEAMSAGLPALVSDVPGNRAVVEDEVNGLVFTRGDSDALASGILALQAAPLRNKLAKETRSSIYRRYSLDRSVRLHLDLYSRLHDRC
jgi:glycosyltransferase involved in cell wall biosynthesis